MNIVKAWDRDAVTTLDKHIVDLFTYEEEGVYANQVRVEDLLYAFARLTDMLADKGIIGETAVKGIIGDPYGFDFKE